MDNGDSFLDVIDGTNELFGNQNDDHGQMFNWEDEFLCDEADVSGSVASESGNLATNVNQSNILLTSQNYAVTSSIPTQNSSIATSHLQQSSAGSQQKAVAMTVVGQPVVNPIQNVAGQTGLTTQFLQQGNRQVILKTSSGGQIYLDPQTHLQLQQQILQQQQQQQQQNMATNFQQMPAHSTSPAPSSSPMHNRSLTPSHSGGLSVSYGTAPTTQTISQLKCASPAPNVNIVHLPPNLQQHQHQQQQQFQLAPGTVLQMPGTAGTQNIVNTGLLHGHSAILGNTQQGTLVNTQNTVIQNPNVVNVNVAAHHVMCNNPAQQRPNLGLANIHTATQSPFNIQGTLIQTAEGKSILIPSQQLSHPINIQQLQVAGQPQVQQTPQNMFQLAQTNVGMDNLNNQGLQQIVVNSQGQQILVQRAQPSGSQNQNIILRTGGAQSGIVQLQQRPGQPVQYQTAQQALQALVGNQQVKIVNNQSVTAQQNTPMINIGGQNVSLQQLANQLGNIQALQLLQQQNVSLQQQGLLSTAGHMILQQQGQQSTAGHMTLQQQGQLSTAGHVTLQQQQQGHLSTAGHVTLQQQGQLSTAGHVTFHQQGQLSKPGHVTLQQQGIQSTVGHVTLQQQGQLSTAGQVTMQQGQLSSANNVTLQKQGIFSTAGHVTVQQQGHVMQGHVTQQRQGHVGASNYVVTSQTPANSMNVNVDNSVNEQTQQILQQIQNSLKMSQSSAINTKASPFSRTSQTTPNVNVMNIKQESSSSNHHNVGHFLQAGGQTVVKSEPNLIETLIKQEPGMKSCGSPQSSMSENIRDLLTGQSTNVTTTVSQACTQMSMFMVSNSSQNVLSNNSGPTSSYSASGLVSASGRVSDISAGTHTLNDDTFESDQNIASNLVNSALPSTPLQPNKAPPGATVQTIHLPPELQQQFQRVQLEIRKVQLANNMTPSQKQMQLQQLQMFQKRILLKGRVLATTKAEPHQIQQGLAALSHAGVPVSQSTTQSTSQSAQLPISHSTVEAQSQSQFTSTTSTIISSPVQSTASLNNLVNTGQGQFGGECHLLGQVSSISSTQNLQMQPDSTSNLGQQRGSALSGITSTQTLSGLLSSTPVNSSNQNMSTSSLNSSESPITVGRSLQQETMPITPDTPTLQNTPSTGQPSVSPSTVTSGSSTPQVAVPTQIKIANKVLTLSLTPAQKDKVQSYLDKMSPEQQQQYLQTQQHVLQRIQKQQQLNAQIRAQVEAQKKQAALAAAASTVGVPIVPSLTQKPDPPALSFLQKLQSSETASTSSKPEVQTIMPEVKVIPVPNLQISSQQSGSADVPLRGQKRSYMDIPKGTLINQQIRQDQNHALNPDTKRPFRSRGDACRRLLRYHVMQKYRPTDEEIEKFDTRMEDYSDELLRKKDWMLERFRVLLLQETIRTEPSSEHVMLQRMQNQDLRKLIEEEKQLVKTNPDAFVPMPMKFLCKQETDSDIIEIKSEPKDDEDDSQGHTNDSDLEHSDTRVKVEVKEEMAPPENEFRSFKMKKLVIKADGGNFSSSFKRRSVDGTRSSADIEGVMDTSGGSEDYGAVHNDSVDTEELVTGLDVEDEDTNDYSDDKFDTMQDEAEHAVLAISSAEESQTEEDENEVFQHTWSRNSQFSGANNKREIGQRHSNFELASESMYYDESQSNDMNVSTNSAERYSSLSHLSSSNGSRKYIPDHSPVSNDSTDNDVTIAGMSDSYNMDLDKFNMYQPITESLTDSEENSYYSADNSAEQNSVMIDDDDDANINKRVWPETMHVQNEGSDSEQESDQEVKAQMASAINSILSLSQGAPSSNPQSVYTYNQSNQLYHNGSQSNSRCSNSNDMEADPDMSDSQSSQHSQSSQQRLGDVLVTTDDDDDDDDDDSDDDDEEANSDLDAAVNSILM